MRLNVATEGNVTDVVFDLSVLPDSVSNPFLCNLSFKVYFGRVVVLFRAV